MIETTDATLIATEEEAMMRVNGAAQIASEVDETKRHIPTRHAPENARDLESDQGRSVSIMMTIARGAAPYHWSKRFYWIKTG